MNCSFGLILHRSSVKLLIEKTAHFWPLQKATEEVFEDLVKQMRNTSLFIRLFKRLCVVVIFLMALWGMYLKKLFYLSYIPDSKTYWFYIIYVTQLLLYVVAVLHVVGYTGLFIGIMTNIIIQYKILNCQLQNNNGCENQEFLIRKIKKCIHHHSFLIRYERKREMWFRLYASMFQVYRLHQNYLQRISQQFYGDNVHINMQNVLSSSAEVNLLI